MPLYEYRCKECEHLEEVLQKVSDPPPAVCPACGKEHSMEKAISLTSFQLKGGGWYKDLYSSTTADKGGKSDTADKSAGKSDKSDKKSAGKGDKKSESKKTDSKKSTSKASKAA